MRYFILEEQADLSPYVQFVLSPLDMYFLPPLKSTTGYWTTVFRAATSFFGALFCSGDADGQESLRSLEQTTANIKAVCPPRARKCLSQYEHERVGSLVASLHPNSLGDASLESNGVDRSFVSALLAAYKSVCRCALPGERDRAVKVEGQNPADVKALKLQEVRLGLCLLIKKSGLFVSGCCGCTIYLMCMIYGRVWRFFVWFRWVQPLPCCCDPVNNSSAFHPHVFVAPAGMVDTL